MHIHRSSVKSTSDDFPAVTNDELRELWARYRDADVRRLIDLRRAGTDHANHPQRDGLGVLRKVGEFERSQRSWGVGRKRKNLGTWGVAGFG
jgi:hypothetical protein